VLEQVLKNLGLAAADLYYILVGWVNGTMSRGKRCGKDRFVGWWDREAERSQNDVNKVCQAWEDAGKKVGTRPVVSPEEAEEFGFENQWDKLRGWSGRTVGGEAT
jgi:hypothetical protein